MAEDRPPASGTSAGTSPAGGGDPSMEDILASIRRILNEDEQPGGTNIGPPTVAGSAQATASEAEPLTLTEDMLVGDSATPTPAAKPFVASPVAPGVPMATPAGQPVHSTPRMPDTAERDGLLSPAAAAAATASVGHLLRAVAAERGSAVSRGGPSIEDVVREELRPLLQDWLDQHLPPLVERLARAEIERVVGRALS